MSDLMDIKQVCTYLNVKMSFIRSMVFNGKIPAVRIGGLMRFSKADIDSWVEQHKIESSLAQSKRVALATKKRRDKKYL